MHLRPPSIDHGVISFVWALVLGVLAFGLGLVFGFTFDTSGPLPSPELRRRAPEVVEEPVPAPEPRAEVVEEPVPEREKQQVL